MQKEVFVYMDLNETSDYVGRLWSSVRRGYESATFQYADSWLQRDDRFALEPALMLVSGPQHTSEDEDLRLLLAPGSSLGGACINVSKKSKSNSTAMAR